MSAVTAGWWADDGSCAAHFPHAESGEEAAQEYVDGGSWGDTAKTHWIGVRTWRYAAPECAWCDDCATGLDADGDPACEAHATQDTRPKPVATGEEWHTIEVEPVEPSCPEGREHQWEAPHEIVGGLRENPGVFGHGGGVYVREVCILCGCGRTTDTWAQDPSTGEQGLTSVEYEPGRYEIPGDA